MRQASVNFKATKEINPLMLSPRNRKLRYLQVRATNAYWLLRQGRFRQFLIHLKSEVDIQLEIVRGRVNNYAEAGVQARLSSDSQAGAQGAANAVPDLDSEYIDRRKIRPPSYKPTIFKHGAAVSMQADAGVVREELRSILSTFNVRERG
jgi:hypothetical protein